MGIACTYKATQPAKKEQYALPQGGRSDSERREDECLQQLILHHDHTVLFHVTMTKLSLLQRSSETSMTYDSAEPYTTSVTEFH